MPAYKERAVNKVLELLLKQSLPENWKLDKILVIACGYKEFYFLKNKKIRILRENKRKGKAYAVNAALKKIRHNTKLDVIIVHNADVFPKKSMLKTLLKPFKNDYIGITCVRPVCLDDSKDFVGFLNKLVWDLHHLVSLENPKVGEVFAFRNIIKKVPKKLAADEAYIEFVTQKRGYKIVYVPNAVVFNRGPRNIIDFINQRRRFFTGHVHVKNKYRYKVSTMSIIRVTKAFLKYLKVQPINPPKRILWLMCSMFLEAYIRVLGTIDFYVFRKVPYAWEIIKSSKNNLK